MQATKYSKGSSLKVYSIQPIEYFMHLALLYYVHYNSHDLQLHYVLQ